jgi:hypothetical protein
MKKGRGIQSSYTLQVSPASSKIVIEGSCAPTLAQYINHSCNPNCFLQTFWFRKHLIAGAITSREIEAGEFLSVKYNRSNSTSDWFDICCCGAPNCPDRMRYLSGVASGSLGVAVTVYYHDK